MSVVARLRDEVVAGRLSIDASQQSAAQLLDALREALIARPRSLSRRLKLAVPWLSKAANIEPERGLYLWGGVGRGKTLLMDLFFETLPAGLGERTHFYHFMRQVHTELGAIKQHTDPLEIVAARIAERIRVICFDEFFVSDIGDAMLLAGLFEGLFRRGVTLVATSNVPPQELYKNGLQRQRFVPAIALLGRHVNVLHLDGGVDYRLRQLARAPTYVIAESSLAREELRRRFDALAGGLHSGPVTLTIEERPLRALDTASGMAWFEFTELCEGPRSQNDYIELARRYHTLFVSNVPRFEPTSENAARRFIMLIDELYDRGVKAVLSAAAPPTELYHGERVRFEFERTSSRLIEMQTEEYLAGQHRP